MSTQRQKRLMQEALDEQLTLAERRELHEQLDNDPRATAEFDRLRLVDQVLADAPAERAPRHLTVNIMSALVDQLQHAPELSRISGLALAVGLVVITALLIPCLLVIGWLVINAVGSAAVFATVLSALMRVLSLVIAGASLLVTTVQDWLMLYPALPVVLLMMIPVALFGLLRFRNFTRPTEPGAV